jgi:ADP-glucose pyrophosphorylase
MENKNLSVDARLNLLKQSFAEKTPKQMRTIRNNLNNRIRSFEEEAKFGKALPKLSASHMFFEFELKELKSLLEAAQKTIKSQS